MPANLAARRSLPDVHEDLWVTTKAMYAALVGGRDEEFERLLNARERLLLETGTQQLDADSLDAGRVLRIGHKIVRAHRNHAPHVARPVPRPASSSRPYAAGLRGTGAITNLGG